MKVLLLGATGMLGHNVAVSLLERGHDVVALVRRREALQLGAHPSLHVVVGSLTDDNDLFAAAGGCEAMINCAGTTDMSLPRISKYMPINRDLCLRMVQAMERTGITRLVHVSTANTIGHGDSSHPADESAEIMPPFSQSLYAISKSAGESILANAAEKHPNWHIVIINPGFIVGAYDAKPSSGALLLAGFRKKVMAVPSGGKSFVAAADVAQATVNALTLGRSGERYLVTGEGLTLREFYLLQAEVCGYRQKVLLLPDPLVKLAGCVGSLLRAIGVRTQLSLNNVQQLMVREHYNMTKAVEELALVTTPIEKAIKDFYEWRASSLTPKT